MPKRKKNESKTEYARRMHWAGKKHTIIARKLLGQIQEAILIEAILITLKYLYVNYRAGYTDKRIGHLTVKRKRR